MKKAFYNATCLISFIISVFIIIIHNYVEAEEYVSKMAGMFYLLHYNHNDCCVWKYNPHIENNRLAGNL